MNKNKKKDEAATPEEMLTAVVPVGLAYMLSHIPREDLGTFLSHYNITKFGLGTVAFYAFRYLALFCNVYILYVMFANNSYSFLLGLLASTVLQTTFILTVREGYDQFKETLFTEALEAYSDDLEKKLDISLKK